MELRFFEDAVETNDNDGFFHLYQYEGGFCVLSR